MCDRQGAIYKGRPGLNWIKAEMAEETNLEHKAGTLADILAGADVFIGVSAPGTLTREMVASMKRDAIVFACANPTPEIFPEEAKAGGARALEELVGPEEIGPEYIIPRAFDKRVGPAVSAAVARAARESGVARL